MPRFTPHVALHTALLLSTLVASTRSWAADSSGGTDLLCDPSAPNDCYPRVFQPTEEFQAVRDGQELPSGLHVRMNIWTGEKEAKINVPGDDDASLEGLPVDRGVVVVESEAPGRKAPRIPNGAPAYEALGKVKKPEQEADSFHRSMEVLVSAGHQHDEDLDGALERLEDLSHDIYYGLKVAQDSEALRRLLCLMTGPASADAPTGSTPRDQQAAAVLGGALQNNPAALQEVSRRWGDLLGSRCSQAAAAPLHRAFYSGFVPGESQDAVAAKTAASRAKAQVAAVNGLVKDDKIRADFLRNGGVQRLLEVLVRDGDEWAGAQRQVGQLVLDNFLDESMGAKLGQWPQTPKLSDGQCRTGRHRTDDGCWDFHVERIVEANKADHGHWSRRLQELLALPRKDETGPRRGEL